MLVLFVMRDERLWTPTVRSEELRMSTRTTSPVSICRAPHARTCRRVEAGLAVGRSA